MIQEDSSPSQPEPLPQAKAGPVEDIQGDSSSRTGGIMNGVPYFPVIGTVTYKPVTVAPKRESWRLPTGMARIVSVVGLSTALLWPLSACSTSGDADCVKPGGSSVSGIGSSNDCDSSSSGSSSGG